MAAERSVGVVLCVVLGAAGCGRIWFAAEDVGSSIDGGGALDGSAVIDASAVADGSAALGDSGTASVLLTSSTTCQAGPTTLTLGRDAAPGETLLVVFFMREPGVGTPSITGATAGWVTDVSFSTVASINRRHISVFRAPVTIPLPADTSLQIDHPAAGASGAAVLIAPGTVTRPAAEAAFTAEGSGAAFTGTLDTTGSAALCVVAHYNNTSAAFAAGWTSVLDLPANCGTTRQSAAVHVAARDGSGTVACSGMLGSNLTWAIGIVGYRPTLVGTP